MTNVIMNESKQINLMFDTSDTQLKILTVLLRFLMFDCKGSDDSLGPSGKVSIHLNILHLL